MATKTILLSLPLKTASLNIREVWQKKARRVKAERSQARLIASAAPRMISMPVMVTMTRLSPGTLDGDNLQGAMKAIRDGIADAYGVDDATPLIEWRYEQQKCKPRAFGVCIRIERRA